MEENEILCIPNYKMNQPTSPLSKKNRHKYCRNSLMNSAHSPYPKSKYQINNDSAYQSYNTDISFNLNNLSFTHENKLIRHSSPHIKNCEPHYFDHPIYQLNSENDDINMIRSPIYPHSSAKDINLSTLKSNSLFTTICDKTQHEISFSDNTSNNSDKDECLVSPPRLSFNNLHLFDKPQTPFKSMKNLKRKYHYSSIEKNPIQNGLTQSTPQTDKKRFLPESPNNLLENSLSKESLHKQIVWMRESQAARYLEEFVELTCLGSGHFGHVYKCINRLDGCHYAIKKSKTPLSNPINEYTAIKEVCAHAILGNHPHIVRYFSAWAEEGIVFIQNEYCNGGTLADINKKNISLNTQIPEEDLKVILIHVGKGLKYFHALKLAHLDIKPSNIFVTKCTPSTFYNNSDEGFESDDEKHDAVVYKIGDLGLVTSLTEPEVEEGDCRYLPIEILQEDYSDITKADIFSLGISLYEAASNTPLPPNGDEWQRLRNGEIPFLTPYSKELNILIQDMLRPLAKDRPSANLLIRHPTLCPLSNKTKVELKKELNAERFKNQILIKKLEAAESENMSYKRHCQSLESYDRTKGIVLPTLAINPKKLVIGIGVKRSLSVKDF
ncbi:unnamed protein product [Gordionus sp. m RMFG-2023]